MDSAAQSTVGQAPRERSMQVLSIFLDGQSFGVPIANIQDVLKGLALTTVPMAPPRIAGIANLRGRIVTAVDLHQRLCGQRRGQGQDLMNVVTESRGELYALLVDQVGDVLTLGPEEVDPPPLTLDRAWQPLCTGIHKREEELMVILDPDQVIHGE